MVDKEKVMKGLEQCREWNGNCCRCPYHSMSLEISECSANLCKDAEALIKDQEDKLRVMYNRCKALTLSDTCDICMLREECKKTRGMKGHLLND